MRLSWFTAGEFGRCEWRWSGLLKVFDFFFSFGGVNRFVRSPVDSELRSFELKRANLALQANMSPPRYPQQPERRGSGEASSGILGFNSPDVSFCFRAFAEGFFFSRRISFFFNSTNRRFDELTGARAFVEKKKKSCFCRKTPRKKTEKKSQMK